MKYVTALPCSMVTGRVLNASKAAPERSMFLNTKQVHFFPMSPILRPRPQPEKMYNASFKKLAVHYVMPLIGF